MTGFLALGWWLGPRFHDTETRARREAVPVDGLGFPSSSGLSEGSKAPDWVLHSISGESVSSRAFDGRVVLVDFWATWCPPCHEMIPSLVELQESFGPEGLQVVGICLEEEDLDAVRKLRRELNINYPVVEGTPEVVKAFGGIQMIPTSFLLDRDGIVLEKTVGFQGREQLEAMVRSAL